MRAAYLTLPLLLLAASSIATAQTKPEDVIKYRKAQYTVLLWNWMPLNAMVRGRIPFDAAEFARRAERVAAVAPQLLEGFPEGSAEGAPTDAKPEIWTDFADFSAKMKDLERETAALATIATTAQFASAGDRYWRKHHRGHWQRNAVIAGVTAGVVVGGIIATRPRVVYREAPVVIEEEPVYEDRETVYIDPDVDDYERPAYRERVPVDEEYSGDTPKSGLVNKSFTANYSLLDNWYLTFSDQITVNYHSHFKFFVPFCGYSNPIYITQRVLRI